MSVDHSLIHAVEKVVDGANIHGLRAILMCYEKSTAGTKRRELCERLLRGFVAQSKLNVGVWQKAAQLCAIATSLHSENLEIPTLTEREAAVLHAKALGSHSRKLVQKCRKLDKLVEKALALHSRGSLKNLNA